MVCFQFCLPSQSDNNIKKYMFFTINVDVKMFFTTMLLFYGTITLFFIFDHSNNLIITIGMEEFKP